MSRDIESGAAPVVQSPLTCASAKLGAHRQPNIGEFGAYGVFACAAFRSWYDIRETLMPSRAFNTNYALAELRAARNIGLGAGKPPIEAVNEAIVQEVLELAGNKICAKLCDGCDRFTLREDDPAKEVILDMPDKSSYAVESWFQG